MVKKIIFIGTPMLSDPILKTPLSFDKIKVLSPEITSSIYVNDLF